MIEIIGLKKSFNGKEILNIEYLAFADKKCCALLGDNGSGKSTLLRVLAGIIEPDEGQIVWRKKCGIAYMPQKPYPFRMPAWKSVLLGSSGVYKTPGGKQAEGERLLAEIGLERLSASFESKFSGGEAQRTAFARVINLQKEILLLDEPTSAMDKEGTELAEKLLKKYKDENEATVIFATHSMPQALRLADEAVLMSGGAVIKHGAVEQIAKERI